jgi:sulfate transporter 3
MKKLNKSQFIENIGQNWIYLTVGEAVGACTYMLHTCKPNPEKAEPESWNSV